MGSAAARQVHVGVGADGARLPETLLVLFGLADRRPEAPSAGGRAVIEEIVELRRQGFRFIALADDNFYPVALADLARRPRAEDQSRTRASSRPHVRSGSS